MKKSVHFLVGVVVGIMLMSCVGFTRGNQEAIPSWQPIYVDGEQVSMEAYNINGNNYVKLRDIGREVGFNVYWSDGVRVDSTSGYTGEPPVRVVENEWTKPITEGIDLDAIRLDIVDGINALRRTAGARELPVNDALMAAAQTCAEQRWSGHHIQEECGIVANAGYPYGFLCNLTDFSGVNAAGIAEEAVSNWEHSPGHYEAAVDPANDSIGVGVLHTAGRTYCVLLVGDSNSNSPYN